MRPRLSVRRLLVRCSVLWVVLCSSPSSGFSPPLSPPPRSPPGCDSMLVFSSLVSSSSDGNGNIASRSLSPWSWRSSTVKNRIPSTLWEANCSSSLCLSLNPGHTNKQNLNSVPIYQDVLVLNRSRSRSRKGGRYCYTASYQSVAVGCTCVWAKTDQN